MEDGARMVLDWLAKGNTTGPAASVPDLLARKQHSKAVELAQAQLKARPRDGRLRLQLADTLIAAGRGREAVPPLREMADELARDGFAAKAIAILKRIQKIDPGRIDVEKRLATMIADRTRQEAARPATSGVSGPELGMEIGFEPSAVREVASGPESEPAPEPAAAGGTDAEAGGGAAAPLADFAPVAAADGDDLIELEPGEVRAAPTPALFPDFSNEELVAVMDGLRLTTFPAGALVVAEGEPGDSLFLVTTGTLKTWVRNHEGRYVFVRRLGEGDFFGEISVLSGSPRTASVVAATPCELLELDRPTLDAITAAYPRVRDVLQRFYEQRMATSVDAMASTGKP